MYQVSLMSLRPIKSSKTLNGKAWMPIFIHTVKSIVSFICWFQVTCHTYWVTALWWREKHSKLVAKFKFPPLNLREILTFQEEPGPSAAEPAFVQGSITPRPTPTSTRMYSMPVGSVTDTERILWTDDTTHPFKAAEQTAWLTSCLHSQPFNIYIT